VKVIRTAAHARNTAPPFGIVGQAEILKLRQLPAWVRWLLLELRLMSDFQTGMVSTSYAQLVAMLDCDQPQTGGRRLESPTLKQVRTALDWLDAMGLAVRDKRNNEAKGVLKIRVTAASSLSASASVKGRGKGRVKTAQNTDEHEVQAKVTHSDGQGLGQVFQNSSSSTRPPENLSTGKARQQVKKQLEEMRAASGRTRKMPPPGGVSAGPAGHAPPVTALRIGDVLGAGSRQAPPGGQKTAPGGHAPPSNVRKGKGRGGP
jgi:hypothetical protein